MVKQGLAGELILLGPSPILTLIGSVSIAGTKVSTSAMARTFCVTQPQAACKNEERRRKDDARSYDLLILYVTLRLPCGIRTGEDRRRTCASYDYPLQPAMKPLTS